MLTRSAGSGPDVEVHLKQVELFQGDLLLLCSDGLHGYLTEDRIAALIGSSEPIPARTEALIAATRAAGAPDNVSAVLVQYLP
jgi:serine/threonine protein phosphatase PrpC